ncbi:hypothetical protein [Sphingobium sp.]|uniref:hypothetical protein n=1 Tax=Sphingobium sp. TaxID=1912891 RepID=UPI002E23E5B7
MGFEPSSFRDLITPAPPDNLTADERIYREELRLALLEERLLKRQAQSRRLEALKARLVALWSRR